MGPREAACLDRLVQAGRLSAEDWTTLLAARTAPAFLAALAPLAQARAQATYGKTVYIRGLIELTNICRNNCYYCGIRRDNREVSRYRLSEDQVLEACQAGYRAGFRTFVLQGGEDPYWTDDRLVPFIQAIRHRFPDCVLTLSLGERSRESYARLYAAGARRYLLRHETADPAHYSRLHPDEMSLARRLEALADLQALGFQAGCGMMVGSPGQGTSQLVQDFLFIQDFQPQMVGLGPFIPHHATPFADQPAGGVTETLVILALVRLVLPKVLLPATTALATLDPRGHLAGIASGCNVIMPNLSPPSVRKNYSLYDGKRSSGTEAAENVQALAAELATVGYKIVVQSGDHPDF
ncbi:[FeFe] hydrogenase H-cluster radical SAM maturase HydE [Peptococcus simiae]|uniref:[FeFe] hydrogenase H-cluster radical SAM maturase HydE n=1 Tax=Peptococcus simiae TaxID=1643805 RepID=UPI00397FE87B